MARRHPNVVNLSEIEPHESRQGSRFECVRRRLHEPAGARDIACAWFEVPPGKTAFPAHYHCANEEAIYVLEGTGTLRVGDDSVSVGPGDYAAFPVGPAAAHQLINTGEAPLRYLCMSTTRSTEVVGYPDSNKIAALSWPDDPGADEPFVAKWFPADAEVDYFHGEDTGE